MRTPPLNLLKFRQLLSPASSRPRSFVCTTTPSIVALVLPLPLVVITPPPALALGAALLESRPLQASASGFPGAMIPHRQ
jgi:hypothetical protein